MCRSWFRVGILWRLKVCGLWVGLTYRNGQTCGAVSLNCVVTTTSSRENTRAPTLASATTLFITQLMATTAIFSAPSVAKKGSMICAHKRNVSIQYPRIPSTHARATHRQLARGDFFHNGVETHGIAVMSLWGTWRTAPALGFGLGCILRVGEGSGLGASYTSACLMRMCADAVGVLHTGTK